MKYDLQKQFSVKSKALLSTAMTLFLPSFLVMWAERKINKFCRKGFRLISVEPIVMGYRFLFTPAQPAGRKYYIFCANDRGPAHSRCGISPGEREKIRLESFCRQTVFCDAALFVGELNADAEPEKIKSFSTEKMRSAMRYNFLFLLFWVVLFLLGFLAMILFPEKVENDLLSICYCVALMFLIFSYYIAAIIICRRELHTLQQ